MINFLAILTVLISTSQLRAAEVQPLIIPLEKKLTSDEFGHFLIPVEADTSKMNLIFDTGSKSTVIAKNKLDKIYEPNGYAFNTSMTGKKNRLRTIFLGQLKIGSTIISKPRVALAELNSPGLLGIDILSEKCFDLNTKTPSLSLTQNCEFKASEKFEFFDNKLIVLQVKLQDKVYPMIFDTGASITVVDSALPWQEFAEKIDSKSVRIVDSARQKDIKEVYKAKSFTVYGKTLPNIRFIRSDLKGFQKKSKLKVQGIIGFNLIMGGDWKFDIKSKEFSLSVH